MKILILSWYFPPVNAVAAIRTGKMARFFLEAGHDVKVITARKSDTNRSLKVELPADCIHETDWIDVDKIIHPLSNLARAVRPARPAAETPPASQAPSAPGTPGAAAARGKSLKQRLSGFYNNLFFFPDRYVGWVPRLLAAGRQIDRGWKADMIYASGPPFSVFLGAHFLSRRTGVPWVAEFRDRWVDDPYFPPPPWRHGLERRLERTLISGASGIVTVSSPWADFFRDKYAKPTQVIYNGFDPADFPLQVAQDFAADGPVRIVHTGSIYPGRRDPSPVFEAIAKSDFTPDQVRVVFCGARENYVQPLAAQFGITDFVETVPPVSYAESLKIQRNADVLLLLQWNNPLEQGNVPAKVFEYLASMRPILGIGYEQGVPAGLIRERRAGLYSSDPAVIGPQLKCWIEEKRRAGSLANLPVSVRDGLERDAQYRILENFLVSAAGKTCG